MPVVNLICKVVPVERLNFFRLHLLLFVLAPLIASVIFYWLNVARTENEMFVRYIDSLFLCVSAITVAGLFPVVLSNIQVGQQIVLAVLTTIGSYSFVSTATVVIRRHYFSKEMDRRLKEVEKVSGHSGGSDPLERKSVIQNQSMQNQYPGLLEVTRRQIHDNLTGSLHDSEGYDTLRRRPGGHDGAFLSIRREGTLTTTVPTTIKHGVNFRRSDTQMTTAKDRGYGGFQSPLEILRCITIPSVLLDKLPFRRRATSLRNSDAVAAADSSRETKPVPYLSFNAIVGKNSSFQDLSQEQKEEIGGVELRALNLLTIIVPLYWFGIQALAFVILAPYMSRKEFRSALSTDEGQAAPVNSTWFSLFQIISSYANNGILVDASLVPLQKAYLLLWVMIILILAGNTAFPCFLRLFLWIGYKFVPTASRHHATLSFILDHPRRCFLYLFPSTQTWYLVTVLVSLNIVDWILFLLLDIDNGPIQSIPTGVRVMAGLFQAVAVRCGGFQIVSLGALAPAVQVLYVVMMYVGALPLALGVRSTNVYEDRSIALYEQRDDEELYPLRPGLSKTQVWGEYMTWHLKRQLSFDIWWLALAVFLITVFERGKMLSPDKGSYITVFSILFEVVSAYGTVGLSLGVPSYNYSLSGALGTASKLVLCCVMLRGRHRGLPDAIDRSVLLPGELGRQAKMESEFRERERAVKQALRDAGVVGWGDDTGSGSGEDCDIPPGMA